MEIQKVLIIGQLLPEPNATAAGKRMLGIIHLMQSIANEVFFVHLSPISPLSVQLENIGVNTQQFAINDSSFDEFLKDYKPNCVIFDRFYTEEQMGWRVAEICPNALRVLDMEDFHALRQTRQTAVQKNEEWNLAYLQNSDIFIREISSMYRCDISWVISSAEMEILTQNLAFPKSLLHYYPLSFDFKTKGKSFDERKNIVLLGNFMHAPNADSVKWTYEHFLPQLIQWDKNIQIHVYGAYAQSFKTQYKHPNFILKSYLADINTLGDYKILLAPLRFGAGVKGKVLDAYAHGLPVVGSTIAWEGLTDQKMDLNELFTQCKNIYSNKTNWENEVEQTTAILQQKFLLSNSTKLVQQHILNVYNNLTQHRNQNYWQKILLQNQFNATKFMSKWIEEKNKK
jgi:hypothetical protein